MQILEIQGLNDSPAISLFFEVAAGVYRDDPVWVAESEELFLPRFKVSGSSGRPRMWPIVALDDACAVARGVAILAPGAMDPAGNPEGWIGFFESREKHKNAAKSVLQRCEEILKTAGATTVLAPKVDSLLLGLQTGGFELPQTILTNHNPPYYLDIFREHGYEVHAKMRTFVFTRENTPRLRIEIPGFTTRELDRAQLSREIAIFHELQSSIFHDRSGYVSRSFEEDHELVESFLPFLDDDLMIIAEDAAGTPAALLICVPDIYQAAKGQAIDRARIMSIGARPGLQDKGLGVAMASHLMRNLLRKGYQTAEGSLALETNAAPGNLAKRFSAQSGREFAILAKRL